MIVRPIVGLVAALSITAAEAVSADASRSDARSHVLVRALTLLDTPYRYGGSSPESGFDCSGLVRYVYSVAMNLPRRSEDIGKMGEPIVRSELEPGDLVFFNTLSRAYSHVAIYIGEGRFLHAPARGGKVRIEALDDQYWRSRFNGARRVLGSTAGAAFSRRVPPPLPPSAEAEIVRP